MLSKTKVLIIDDSALVRDILKRGLSLDTDLEIVGTACDPYEARDMIVHFKPDVLTLDVEMPRMDGLEFLKKLMPQFPLPVVMVSSLTESGSRITLDSLAAGAVDFVCKPSGNLKEGLMHMMTELSAKIKTASAVNVSHYRNNGSKAAAEIKTKVGDFYSKKDVIIAIGASTGGTEAISKIITTLPKSTPGIVIVQHMPEKFTKMFASRLNNESDLDIKEAESGDSVERGKVLIAPGGRHIQIFKSDNDYKVVCRDGDTVCGHKPSVDVLFRSMARYVKDRAIGIMLTGMGSDGADAMYKMREAGARTIAQDRKTSVVFGMPKEAHERGGVEFLMPLDRIAEKIKMLAEETK